MDDFNNRPRRPRINLDNKPPEDTPVKHSEALSMPVSPAPPLDEAGAVTVPENIKKRFRLPKSKKVWALIIVAALLVLGGGATAIYWFVIREEPVPIVHEEPAPEPEPVKPTTEASITSGVQVQPEVNKRVIFAVQIENSPEARPQSGLIDADIVFEAVAEGGITRFDAIFHDNQPDNIGPVRSLRPYYIDWFWPFGAAIVHAGGSPKALADIKKLGLMDIDHGANAAAFRRVSNRYAPHNLYTRSKNIQSVIADRGYKNTKVRSLLRKEPAPVDEATARKINLQISSANYNVTFTYDKKTNKYLRAQAGTSHKDADSGKQISPTVVIVPVLTKGIDPDRVHTKYGTIGSGKVFVFQDGTVTIGTWSKKGRQDQWQIKDKAGKPIAFNPGQTWFTMIDSAGSVTYAP